MKLRPSRLSFTGVWDLGLDRMDEWELERDEAFASSRRASQSKRKAQHRYEITLIAC